MFILFYYILLLYVHIITTFFHFCKVAVLILSTVSHSVKSSYSIPLFRNVLKLT